MEDIKLKALSAMAEAYYNRGVFVQYDERTLNRSGSERDERRQKGMPPEYGTKQNTLHLDCSSFVYSVYYQTFGIELEADLTEGLIELANIRPFYYVVTHKETKEERDAIYKSFMDELRPGDAVICRNSNEDNGHIMLHVGEGRLLHCTSAGGGGSYVYDKKHDTFEKEGGIKVGHISDYFQEDENGQPTYVSYFHERKSRFAILRPYKEDQQVLPNAIARVEGIHNIIVEKTDSVKPSHSVKAGDEIEYFIEVTNRDSEPREICICDSTPEGTELIRGCTKQYMLLAPYEKKMVSFAVRVTESAKDVICADGCVVNGYKMPALKTIVGNRLSCEQKTALRNAVSGASCSCKWEFVKKAYKDAFGFELPCDTTAEVLGKMLVESKIDTQVLIPDRTQGIRAMLVPDFYGGKNMETNFSFSPVRIRETRECCFDTGDIVVFTDTESVDTAEVWMYLGEGKFVSSDGKKTGKDAYDLMQSLLGRFGFFVLRPAFAM